MRSMINSLLQSINKISWIDEKIMKIDKKEQENKFADNMRSMIASLLKSTDNVSEINKKILYMALIKKFPNTYWLSDKYLDKFALLLRICVYPYE